MNRIRPHLPLLSVFLFALLLVIHKWPYLSLPAYWDEGFPYIYGIRYLHDHQLTMMPNGMPELFSTGHPTLFYFLSAGWMRIFGTEIGIAHIFPLLISVLLLFAVFRLGKKIASPWIGTAAAFLLVTRTIFITQSSFLLPETLLALFATLAIQAWIENKKGWYLLWASLLLLTKEPGLVLIGVFGLIDLISFFSAAKKEKRTAFIKTIITALPIIPIVLFFIIQRMQMGWFFFPRHLNSFHTSSHDYFDKLIKCFGSHFFIYYGGIASTVIVFLAFIFFKIRKIELKPEQKKIMLTSFMFLIAFILFSSFSFPIPRYMLCIYGPWFITCSLILVSVFSEKRKKIAYGILFAIGFIQLGYAYDIRSQGDFDLGYTEMVKTQKEAIRWCVDHQYQHKKICTTQQLQRGMESDAAGFVNKDETFTAVDAGFNAETALFIFTSTETSDQEQKARKLNLKQLIRFGSGKAWTEILTADTSSTDHD